MDYNRPDLYNRTDALWGHTHEETYAGSALLAMKGRNPIHSNYAGEARAARLMTGAPMVIYHQGDVCSSGEITANADYFMITTIASLPLFLVGKGAIPSALRSQMRPYKSTEDLYRSGKYSLHFDIRIECEHLGEQNGMPHHEAIWRDFLAPSFLSCFENRIGNRRFDLIWETSLSSSFITQKSDGSVKLDRSNLSGTLFRPCLEYLIELSKRPLRHRPRFMETTPVSFPANTFHNPSMSNSWDALSVTFRVLGFSALSDGAGDAGETLPAWFSKWLSFFRTLGPYSLPYEHIHLCILGVGMTGDCLLGRIGFKRGRERWSYECYIPGVGKWYDWDDWQMFARHRTALSMLGVSSEEGRPVSLHDYVSYDIHKLILEYDQYSFWADSAMGLSH